MALRRSTVSRHSPNQPKTTLSYIVTDDLEQDYNTENATHIPEKAHDTVKTEKSVHFATEYESSSEKESTFDSLKTSQDAGTLQPSEHLYSGDTFITESHVGAADSTSNQTELSYGTCTFVALESEDETRTASDISHSETSLASSTVFSQSETSSDTGTASREWKDVTDIVKDIDELEESEFVTRRDSIFSGDDEATDIPESEDEEMTAIQREHFLLGTIRRLRLRDVLSPRSLIADVHSVTESESDTTLTPRKAHPMASKEEKTFCQQMIENCEKIKQEPERVRKERSQRKERPQVLEYYGLSSAVVDRIRFENLKHRLAKRSLELDKSILESLNFVEKNQDADVGIQRQKFISQMMAEVQRDNTEERIQAHLIKMHPIKCFGEFVNGLPKVDETSREILYKYKRKLEAEKEFANS